MRVFIDGGSGTTGLRIKERLAARGDVELVTLTEEKRKDASARAECLNECDVAYLCLPDAAAIEAVEMVKNPRVRVIDSSTAHRTLPGWAYGFPELSSEHRSRVASLNRIAVPGCHASGFVSIVYPMVKRGLVSPESNLMCVSVTGYSGGGKKMIAEYESQGRDSRLSSPRQYATGQTHKHLREMTAITGLANAPIFTPIVADFYSGMAVTVGFAGLQVSEVSDALSAHYAGARFITVSPAGDFIAGNEMTGRDDMRIMVSGTDGRVIVTSLFDNLGKGASGAAIECMNISLGLDEALGLNI